jgi:hypothetical protein
MENLKVNVVEHDSITGSTEWQSTIEDLKSWELTKSEIDDIENGKTVKCYSPNGRRRIWITKTN